MEGCFLLNSKICTAILLLLVIIFTVLIRLPYLNVPLERDEGGYAYIAWRMEQGELPYKDVYDNKPPLIYFIYLLIFKIFGYSVKAIHSFLLLWVLAEVLLIYKFSQKIFQKNSIALLAAAIFAVITSEPGVFGGTANTEIFMLLPLIGSYVFLLLAEEEQNPRWLFLCGALNGIAFMIKPVAFYNFAGAVIYLSFVTFKKHDLNNLGKKYFYSVIGFIVIPILILVYFWWRDAARELIYWVFSYNLDYMSVGGSIWSKEALSSFWRRFSFILTGDILFWAFGLYAFVLLLRKNVEVAVLLMTWLVMSFFGVASGKRFFPHYFIQILPPLAVGAAWGIWYFVSRQMKVIKNKGIRNSLIYCLAAGVIILPLKANYKYLFIYTPDQISERIYNENPFVAARQIASYLAAQTLPADTIAILGSEPEILYYAQRKSATKYIYFHHVLWRKTLAEVLQKQKEVIIEIENNNPQYLIAVNIDTSVGKKEDTPDYLFNKMRQVIKDEYSLAGFVSINSGATSYVFGQENVKKHAESLRLEQQHIMIYKRYASHSILYIDKKKQ